MAEVPASAPALSIVVPVYNGASTVGELVSLGGGKFAVRGSHQYLATGSFAVKVTINDVGGSTTTASSTAHVI